jgi:peptidoglycan/xylan/chitin deacetylase (PgdA/CDA1 family)
MSIRIVARGQRILKQLKKRFVPNALILLYHRVTELPLDPQLLCVTPQHFKEHLEILRKHYLPKSLKDLIGAYQNKSIPNRAVVITFDDGYADNLYNAKPLLERFDFPATVFVTTGYLGQERQFWWDETERLFLLPGTIPKKLSLEINGHIYQWDLGQASHFSDTEYKDYRRWNILEKKNPHIRHRLYREIYQLLWNLSPDQRQRKLDEVLVWAGLDTVGRPDYRSLSGEEVSRLAEGGLLEVGAHTVTHAVLARLSIDCQRQEIQNSKARLEGILNKTIESFSYPYGSRNDYSQDTVSLVRESGFNCACSNFEGLVCQDSGQFELPRVLIRDWGAAEFESRIKKWFDGEV